MHKIEEWVEDVYNRCFGLDRDSVRKFIRKGLRDSPMENPNNSMNVLSGVVEMNSMYADIYLIEEFNYRKELREE